MKSLSKLLVALIFIYQPLQTETPQENEKREIHALIAIDTLSDLKDSCIKDMNHIKKEVQLIQAATNIKVHVRELRDEFLTLAAIRNWLKAEPIQPQDVIIFYYSGHGFRTKINHTIWPSIYLPRREEWLDMYHLIKELSAKPAALFIIIADCCNNFIKIKSHTQKPYLDKSRKEKDFRLSLREASSYKKLLLENFGLIIASGAIPGKISWATDKGSIFTNAFLNSIHSELEKSDPQWERIFTRTMSNCRFAQKPQFFLLLSPTDPEYNRKIDGMKGVSVTKPISPVPFTYPHLSRR